MNSIFIKFKPHKVTAYSDEKDVEQHILSIENGEITSFDIVEWCSLPDILFEEKTRKFLGLSFAIDSKYKEVISKAVESFANTHCRYISSDDNLDRYTGFGKNDHLEILWEQSNGEVICEFSSLYEGCWLYFESEKKNMIPYGYYLSFIEDIKENYDLV